MFNSVYIATQQCYNTYTPAVVIAETCCPLILVTILLLVGKHSTTLSVVTGLVVEWVSLTMDTKLFGCDTTKMFCCVWGVQLAITVEDDFGKKGIKATNKTIYQIILHVIILINRWHT